MMRKGIALCFALLMGASCKGTADSPEEPVPPSNARVDVSADVLTPETVRVKLGGTVKWINMDTQAHHLVSGTDHDTSVGLVFDSDVLIGSPGFQPFREFSVTFTAAGDVPYFCSTHPGTLVGIVHIVQ